MAWPLLLRSLVHRGGAFENSKNNANLLSASPTVHSWGWSFAERTFNDDVVLRVIAAIIKLSIHTMNVPRRRLLGHLSIS